MTNQNQPKSAGNKPQILKVAQAFLTTMRMYGYVVFPVGFKKKPGGIQKFPLFAYANHPECLIHHDTSAETMKVTNVYNKDGKQIQGSVYTKWQTATGYGIALSPKRITKVNGAKYYLPFDIDHHGIDEDFRRAVNAFKALGIPTDTFITKSPTGKGVHPWLECTYAEAKNPIDLNIPDIDCKLTFIVGPGSVVPKNIAGTDEDLVYKHRGKPTKFDFSKLVIVSDKIDISKINQRLIDDFITRPDDQPYLKKDGRDNKLLELMNSLYASGRSRLEAEALIKGVIHKFEQIPGDVFTVKDAMEKFDSADGKIIRSSGDHDLKWLEENAFYIKAGSKVRFKNKNMVEVHYIQMRDIYKDRIPDIYGGKNAKGSLSLKAQGAVWQGSPSRQDTEKIGYLPISATDPRYHDCLYLERGLPMYNEYHISMSDNLDDVEIDQEVIDLFLKTFGRTFGHIFPDLLKVLKFKYLHPEVKFNWVAYITSKEEGTGKDEWIRILEGVFGMWNFLRTTPNDVGDKFNSAETTCLFNIMNEAHGGLTRSANNVQMNTLKRKITEESMTSQKKGVDKQLGVASHYFMFIFSNHRASLNINSGSRRFLVYHDDRKMTDTDKANIKAFATLRKKDPNIIKMIMSWVLKPGNVDCTICEDFTPQGHARKTIDLHSANYYYELRKTDDDTPFGDIVIKILSRQPPYNSNCVTKSDILTDCRNHLDIGVSEGEVSKLYNRVVGTPMLFTIYTRAKNGSKTQVRITNQHGQRVYIIGIMTDDMFLDREAKIWAQNEKPLTSEELFELDIGDAKYYIDTNVKKSEKAFMDYIRIQKDYTPTSTVTGINTRNK